MLGAVSFVAFAAVSDSLYFPKGMKWSYLALPSWQSEPYEYGELLVSGDTVIIDGIVYQWVGHEYAVRECDKKIYFCNIWSYPFDNQVREAVVYDFNMNVGDSIRAAYWGNDKWQKVVAVDTIELLNHVKARRLHFDDGDTDIEYICDPVGKLMKRAEGLHGIIPEEIYYSGLCCSVGDELLYEFTPQGCDYNGKELNIPSLCDTWNVLLVRMGANGDELSTEIHRLTTDTIINGKTYVQLYINGSYDGNYDVWKRVTYRGALREDANANVYIVPTNSDHEYLLYAFNAKVGDQLSNLWVGGADETGYLPEGLNARVVDITETSPRIFTIELEEHGQVQWIEGVGLTDEPAGSLCPSILECGCSCGHHLLCAYKNGKQVYASDMSERFGCWYDSSEQQGDTVKLYVQDSPGSSTVNPVDPNELVATVKGDQLIIREFLDKEITYNLRLSVPNSAPARSSGTTQSDTFRETVSIQLTESGSYVLRLTNPDWNYSIVGTFEFIMTELPTVDTEVPAAQKILRNGRLLILHGDQTYTLTGVEVK